MAEVETSPAGSGAGGKPNLLGLNRHQLADILRPQIDRPFRVSQVFDQIYRRGVSDFDQMTDLSRELRSALASSFRISWPEVAAREEASDGTTRYLLRQDDGVEVEAVDIPDQDRRTFCVSSQAGCALGCQFCVTGFWGGGRNLTAGEIIGQVQALARGEALGPARINLVFMGMGEPLLNIEQLEVALEILTEFISWRRITVSTVGILPGIARMAKWVKRPNLAVSLHAPDDERRTRLMPINRVYPLAELLEAIERYPLERGRRVTIEYILIRDFNDSLEDAAQLAARIQPLDVKVNLIPVNADSVLGPRMRPPRPEAVQAFRDRLGDAGLVATVRRRRGDEVSAACGQLRARDREPRGFARRLSI